MGSRAGEEDDGDDDDEEQGVYGADAARDALGDASPRPGLAAFWAPRLSRIGEFAIQLRMKMMTRPGEQFVIRRRAYALIKKAFDANGIKFALPTVHVAEGGESAAAARQVLESTRVAAT